MRYLERQILLQIIDNRWREHLYEMDYLREGIHLRGFAQIDPLVAYKNEGFTMFQELMASIWEEFARVIFHVEVNIEPADFEPGPRPRPRELQYAGGGPEQPSAMQRGRRAAAAAGAAAAAAAGACRRRRRRRRQRPGRARTRRRWSRPTGEDRPQRPLLVRLGQEVQEVPRRLTGVAPEL